MKTETDNYNEFQAKNPTTFDASTLGDGDKYLAARLWKAFMQGSETGRLLEREQIVDRVMQNIFK